jgi:V/A-type H+-transporting ATPase subunit B
MFEEQMMSLQVNIPLERALDLGWEIMAACFQPEETGIKRSMIEKHWPKN